MEWVFHGPELETLQFSCSSLLLCKCSSTGQVLSPHGEDSSQREEHIQLLICVWFKDALFLWEKRPHYSFIEHTTPKYFSHNSLHFVVFSQYETYSHSQDRRYCITSSLWPDIPNLSWDCFTVLAKYLLGAVVWTREAQTLLWGQIHHRVDHKAPTMLWFPWCAESLLQCKVSYTTANAKW